ncbi:hypothetical protein [Gilvibacter sp.]|uniref:hypothetical protein n=1 Tax=Gilvibacter sp. TaxID=2729997 RepID=UPI0025C1EBA5|nr:hypothetical protein [Gilvibacter sp.]NQX78625.1 hypothetical protein [Gilvibacter sp.]
MSNKIKSTDGLVVFWITHVLVISLVYLLVNAPAKFFDPNIWLLLLWIFFVVSVPSLLIMVLVHFLLYSVDERHKRLGIRLMSWVAFLVTFELWKATDGQTNYLAPYFRETFAWAAALLAISHFVSYKLISRFRRKKETAASS